MLSDLITLCATAIVCFVFGALLVELILLGVWHYKYQVSKRKAKHFVDHLDD